MCEWIDLSDLKINSSWFSLFIELVFLE